jgi:hypothetical protein
MDSQMDPDKILELVTPLFDGLRADMAKLNEKCDAVADAVKRKAKRDDDGDGTDLSQETAADRRADSVSRAELRVMQDQINRMAVAQPRKRSDADRNAFADMQAKADVAYRALGERADAPMQGEELIDYGIRLHRPLQKHSKKWAKAELATLARDGTTLAVVMDGIRADAVQSATNPVGLEPFRHREIHSESAAGHKIVEFVGNGTMFKQLTRPGRYVGYIGTSKLRENQSA